MNLLRMYYPLTGKFINDTFNFYCIRLITQVTGYTQQMQLGNIQHHNHTVRVGLGKDIQY